MSRRRARARRGRADQGQASQYRRPGGSETGRAKYGVGAPDGAAGVIERSVSRSGLPREAFVRHLTQTALAGLLTWTEADLLRLLLTAERMGLDPLNNEVYAAQGGEDPTSPVLLVVSLGGWARILNSDPAFDGMHFTESQSTTDGVPDWIECTIHRKDRGVPTTVREYLCEVRGDQGAWLTHPRRMLRHKAMVQCARVCFGLVGIHDPDEAARVRAARTYARQPRAGGALGGGRAGAGPAGREGLKSTIRGLGVARRA
jgi:hypothetical protein